MKSIFYVLAVLAIGASGYFGWEVNKKHETKINERNELITRNKNLSDDITDQTAKKAEAEEALKTAKSERALAEQGLEAAKSKFNEFERTRDEIVGLLEEQLAEEAKVKAVVAEFQTLFPDTDLDDVPRIHAELVDKQKKLTAEVESQEDIKSRLESDVAKNRTEITRVEGKIAESKQRVARNTFQATVTAVDNNWDFVSIGAGERSGLSIESRLLVMRGGRLLGKLDVTKVEANTAIADVVPRSLRPGVALQPGDQVILEETNAN
ncbi:MAG: hypothetical protein ACON38_04105 [Akkermansiaceae bacterium]